jgi:hypothetical protein
VELAGHFEELVAALQFQDITRQRLQHICRALDGLRTELRDADDEVAATGNLCHLQHDQLTWAIGEFCEAMDRLDENLRGMADGVRAIGADAKAVLFTGSNEQRAQIGPSLQAVTVCLENVQVTHLAAGQAVFAVCQAVRDVAALTEEIERLGEEMQLLAQNAAVSAGHDSAKAAGLTVIAGNIQSLAEAAGRHTVAMADGCRQVSSQAEELDARDQQFSGRESDLNQLLQEAHQLIAHLNGVSQSFDAQTAAFGRQIDELGNGMLSTLAQLDIRRQFLSQTGAVLDELAALAREQGDDTQGGADDHLLLGMRERYTMMSERTVHQRFLQRQAARPTETAKPSSASAPAEDFGSNVELF